MTQQTKSKSAGQRFDAFNPSQKRALVRTVMDNLTQDDLRRVRERVRPDDKDQSLTRAVLEDPGLVSDDTARTNIIRVLNGIRRGQQNAKKLPPLFPVPEGSFQQFMSIVQLGRLGEVSREGWMRFEGALKRLKTLDLSPDRIGSRENLLLFLRNALPLMIGLTTLDLRGNDIRVVGAMALAGALPSLTSLTTLVLSGNGIGAGGAIALAPALPRGLTTLDLGYNDIGYGGAIALADALRSLTSLTTLDLRGNDIGDGGAVALAGALPSLTSLTTLILSRNEIGAGGAIALAPALPRGLTTLDLSWDQIGVEGAEALAPALPRGLITLDLRGNDIGYGGAIALARALASLTSLTTLNLSRNGIGDEGEWALRVARRDLTSLTILLWKRDISDEGAVALAAPKKTTATFTVGVQGCFSVTQYDYTTARRSSGHVVLIGEQHDFHGNTPALLRELLDKTECPIDICIEKMYEGKAECKKEYENSLTTYFFKDPIATCSEKGHVPKQTDIRRSTSAFWRDCIEPYRGRVKMWALDFRKNGIFNMLAIPEPYDHPARAIKTELYRMILRHDLYMKDKDAYNKTIRGLYTRYLEARYPDRDDYVRNSMMWFNHGKDHMRLMHDLGFVPVAVAREWIRIAEEELCEDCVCYGTIKRPRCEAYDHQMGIMDIYTALRIVRLLRQDENRIVVFFGGDHHRMVIDRMLTAYMALASKPLLYHPKTTYCVDRKNELTLPYVPCNKKTPRMLAYEAGR